MGSIAYPSPLVACWQPSGKSVNPQQRASQPPQSQAAARESRICSSAFYPLPSSLSYIIHQFHPQHIKPPDFEPPPTPPLPLLRIPTFSHRAPGPPHPDPLRSAGTPPDPVAAAAVPRDRSAEQGKRQTPWPPSSCTGGPPSACASPRRSTRWSPAAPSARSLPSRCSSSSTSL